MAPAIQDKEKIAVPVPKTALARQAKPVKTTLVLLLASVETTYAISMKTAVRAHLTVHVPQDKPAKTTLAKRFRPAGMESAKSHEEKIAALVHETAVVQQEEHAMVRAFVSPLLHVGMGPVTLHKAKIA